MSREEFIWQFAEGFIRNIPSKTSKLLYGDIIKRKNISEVEIFVEKMPYIDEIFANGEDNKLIAEIISKIEELQQLTQCEEPEQ